MPFGLCGLQAVKKLYSTNSTPDILTCLLDPSNFLIVILCTRKFLLSKLFPVSVQTVHICDFRARQKYQNVSVLKSDLGVLVHSLLSLTSAPEEWQTWRHRGIWYTGCRSGNMDRTCVPASLAGRNQSFAPSAAFWGAEPGLAVCSPTPHPMLKLFPACQREKGA